MTDIKVVVMAGDESAELLELAGKSDLRQVTGGSDGELALDPLTVLALTGAAVFVGRFVISVIERRKGGIRIDLGTQPRSVERVKDLPYGVVVIMTADADVRIQTVDEPREVVERILASILTMPRDAGAQEVEAVASQIVAAPSERSDPVTP
jgi:hypothetical protein